MDLKKIIKGSSFMRDGITLVSGNVWAQVIAFASYLILSRLFSPEDFGFYNVFFSYIEVLVIVSTCKYELAVVLADNDREAAAVSRLALRLNTIISIVLLTLPERGWRRLTRNWRCWCRRWCTSAAPRACIRSF